MKKLFAGVLSLAMLLGLTACGKQNGAEDAEQSGTQPETQQTETTATHADHSDIEDALNLRNMGQEWTYSEDADAWVLSIVTAVTKPEIADQQGVSVCVPGAYVKGVDTDGDGEADATNGTVTGALVIDCDAQVTSTNGQVYTAATAPVR